MKFIKSALVALATAAMVLFGVASTGHAEEGSTALPEIVGITIDLVEVDGTCQVFVNHTTGEGVVLNVPLTSVLDNGDGTYTVQVGFHSTTGVFGSQSAASVWSNPGDWTTSEIISPFNMTAKGTAVLCQTDSTPDPDPTPDPEPEPEPGAPGNGNAPEHAGQTGPPAHAGEQGPPAHANNGKGNNGKGKG